MTPALLLFAAWLLTGAFGLPARHVGTATWIVSLACLIGAICATVEWAVVKWRVRTWNRKPKAK